jgi:hypothetical protein
MVRGYTETAEARWIDFTISTELLSFLPAHAVRKTSDG